MNSIITSFNRSNSKIIKVHKFIANHDNPCKDMAHISIFYLKSTNNDNINITNITLF